VRKLNIGCFVNALPGYINVDIEDWPGVDFRVDLNALPWPFEDEEFDEVRAVQIIEHLGKLTKFEIVQEIARITKKGGRVRIEVPNMWNNTALACLQHAHSFNTTSFCPSYTQPWFHLERVGTGVPLPYVFPFRKLTGFFLRLGFGENITYDLRKREKMVVLYESGDPRNNLNEEEK